MNDLPVEILIKIFSYIKDTKTILNLRLTCILFYNINKDIKIYKNNILVYIYKFNKNFKKQNLFIIENPDKKLVGYVDFDYEGYTKILDDMKINVLNNTVYYRNYKNNYFFTRLYDIVSKKTEENSIGAMCNIS